MSTSIEIEDPLAVRIKRRLQQSTLIVGTPAVEDLGPYYPIRVPDKIRENDKSLYEPHLVSIGPLYYHLRDDQLKKSEGLKWDLLKNFWCRSDIPLETYIQELRGLEQQVREYYREPIDLESDDFIQMLLLDGCFIIELVLKWHDHERDILSEDGGLTAVVTDLLLYENQIPLFVIERLFMIFMERATSFYRIAFVCRSLLMEFLMNEELSESPLLAWPENNQDLLKLYHNYLICHLRKSQWFFDAIPLTGSVQRLKHWIILRFNQQCKWPPRQIPSVAKLYEVVKFRKRVRPKHLLDVKLKRGIFEIPQLKMNSCTKKLLANLVEVERYKTGEDKLVTGYLALMASLIKTKMDMHLLENKDIIDNQLSSREEALDFLHKLHRITECDSDNHHFMGLFKKLDLYYSSGLYRHRATLIRNYCNTPWAVISVFVGVIFLILTGLQTFYTVFPYYRPN